MEQFDVVVVGGGHAGCEAAHVAARMGADTALITMSEADLGVMSCNPAIGGLGKGHLVREVDALDGLIGRAADAAGIQFRLLNRRKGPAVQGPRAQADRVAYADWMSECIKTTGNLKLIEAEVADLRVQGERVTGVILADGTDVASQTVVITTGTFLDGAILIGEERYSGGRMGDAASNRLADRFRSFALPLGRLKTGTPPRLHKDTIDWSVLETQPGDPDPTLFSFLGEAPALPQVPCYITHTNTVTHDIIRENLQRSAMYGGHVGGVGPRYCPSIEDKIVRFGDKDSHQVFLEPEGLSCDTVYPNGISTSLPPEVQLDYVRSMKGLEKVEILQPGYAIEYDYVDPTALDAALSLRGFDGLFLAGQINGTTGYEEAAAQGLVAGVNAARFARQEDMVHFSRTNSYIGVMIDDLVTKGVTEPYRMFTSRAEYRLSLRADNADQRLTPLGIDLGCVGSVRRRAFKAKIEDLRVSKELLEREHFSVQDLARIGLKLSKDGSKRDGFQTLGMNDVNPTQVKQLSEKFSQLSDETLAQLARDALYANYLGRQSKEIEAVRRDEALLIPDGFDFNALSSLSSELKGKLVKSQPKSIAQASRIEGMTPAALLLLIGAVRKDEKRSVG